MGLFSSKKETPRDPAPVMKLTPIARNQPGGNLPLKWNGEWDFDEDDD